MEPDAAESLTSLAAAGGSGYLAGAESNAAIRSSAAGTSQ